MLAARRGLLKAKEKINPYGNVDRIVPEITKI